MPSRFQYACFVSYIHSEAELGRDFVLQFEEALRGELEHLVDLKSRPIYRDNILKPGQIWPEALSTALCHSVCMVLIYSPVYGKRPECLREFEAMVSIEDKRRQLLAAGHAEGFIIPVVLRGFDRLPPFIKSQRNAVDFSQFTLAEAPLKRNPLFVNEVKRIAERIQDYLDTLEPLEDQACKDCAQFKLPLAQDMKPWQSAAPLAFPGR